MGNLISIVVPVYKVEKYLDRCIESIVKQTYKNLEIILVDDGSPDNCGRMCDEWAAKDSRIKVIHKENEGLGYARNSGLDAATGEYVAFVDSDDYIMPQTYEKALERLLSENADMCYFLCFGEYNGYKVYPKIRGLKSVYSGKDVVNNFLVNSISAMSRESSCLGMSICYILHKRSVIEKFKIRFYSERDCLSEDLFFRIEECKHISKIAVLPEYLYCYCHNGASLTTSYRPDRFEASLRLYKKLLESTADISSPEMRQRCIGALMTNILVCIKQEVHFSKDIGVKAAKENIKRICDNSIVKIILSEYPLESLPAARQIIYRSILKGRISAIIIFIRLKDLEKRVFGKSVNRKGRKV